MTPVQVISIFLIGLGVGVLLTFFLLRAGAEAGARLVRTGRAVPHRVAPFTPGGEHANVGPVARPPAPGASVEQQAAEAALHSVIERGADHMQELEPGLTRKQAIAKARRALAESGAFDLSGGISGA